VGVRVGVSVGGTGVGVSVGGTGIGVSVGGSGVGVGVKVAVGGTGVRVGVLVGVLLGGTEVAVGGIGVGVCVKTSGVAVGPQAVASSVRAMILDSKGSLFIVSSFLSSLLWFVDPPMFGCKQTQDPVEGACVTKRLPRNRTQREVNAGRIVGSVDRYFCS
jgi:hypothetical protein